MSALPRQIFRGVARTGTLCDVISVAEHACMIAEFGEFCQSLIVWKDARCHPGPEALVYPNQGIAACVDRVNADIIGRREAAVTSVAFARSRQRKLGNHVCVTETPSPWRYVYGHAVRQYIRRLARSV